MSKEIVYYQVVAKKYTDIEGKHSELTSTKMSENVNAMQITTKHLPLTQNHHLEM